MSTICSNAKIPMKNVVPTGSNMLAKSIFKPQSNTVHFAPKAAYRLLFAGVHYSMPFDLDCRSKLGIYQKKAQKILTIWLLTFLICCNKPTPLWADQQTYSEVYALLEEQQVLAAVKKIQMLRTQATDQRFRVETGKLLANILAVYLANYEAAGKEVKELIIWLEDEDHEGKADLIFMAGMFFWEGGHISKAQREFQTIIRNYSQSNQYDRARFMLKQCSGNSHHTQVVQTHSKRYKSIRNIRVLLHKTEKRLKISAPHGIIVSNKNRMLLSMRDPITIQPGGKHFLVNRRQEIFADYLIIKPARRREHLKIGKKRYRGIFQIINKNGELRVINSLPFEDYLKGVVPVEAVPSWKIAALKAQAVASRTFAYRKILARNDSDYHLDATVYSQVYGGLDVEKEKTTQAVMETAGEMITYRGHPISAYFHANSGGYTEYAGKVWNNDMPYLKPIYDPYSLQAPGVFWKARFSRKSIEQKLRKNEILLEGISGIQAKSVTESQRVSQIAIFHKTGSKILRGNNFRLMLGPKKLKSTLFTIEKQKDSFIFSGKGFGHGVGMSQWGANEMAKIGKNYSEILKFYYQNVEINKM